MIRLQCDADEKVLKDIMAGIAHLTKGGPAACAKAINATLKDIRKQAVKLAGSAYTVKAGDLNRKAKVVRAKPGGLLGTLTFKDKRGLTLVRFQAKPNAPGRSRPPDGASVKVLRQGSRKTPRVNGQKAFIATGRGGNTLMMVRLSKGKGGLKALYGPRPIQALGRDDSQRKLEKSLAALLPVNLAREVDAVLAVSLGASGRRR